MNKKIHVLRNILIYLVLIIIIVLGFGGEYIFRKLNYNFGYNFSGEFTNVDSFEVMASNFEQENDVYVDKDGNMVRPVPFRTKAYLKPEDQRNDNEKLEAAKYVEDGIDKDVLEYKIEKRKVQDNPKEVVTYENVDKSQDIMIKTLRQLGYTNFSVRINKDNASITFDIPQVSNPTEEYILKKDNKTNELARKRRIETIQSVLEARGGLEILDAQTGKVLLDDKNISKSSVHIEQNNGNKVGILHIQFDKEGKEKLKDITTKYVRINEQKSHEVELKINGATLSKGEFVEPITTGELSLSLVKLDQNKEKNDEKMEELNRLNLILQNGKVPIKYNVKNVKKDISPIVNMRGLTIVAIAIISIILFMLITLLIFKLRGIHSIVLMVSYIASVLLFTRFTNIYITPEAIIGFVLVIFLNYYLLLNVNERLKNDENAKYELIKISYLLIPIASVSIFLATAIEERIATFGMMVFFAILLMLIHYILFVKPLLLGGKYEKDID